MTKNHIIYKEKINTTMKGNEKRTNTVPEET